MTTSQKGEIAQLKVQLRAAEKGLTSSRPTVDDCRYDLILDDGQKLWRVQIKYAAGSSSHSDGCVSVGLRRWNGRDNTNTRTYTRRDCDSLLVYVQPVDKIACLAPALFAEKTCVNIRYAPAKNAQVKNVIMLDSVLW